MDDGNKKSQGKSGGERANNPANSSGDPPPGISSSAPETSLPIATSSSSSSNPASQKKPTSSNGDAGVGEHRQIRSASISIVASGTKSTEKSTATNTSSDHHRQGLVHSTGSISPPFLIQAQGISPLVKRTFSGRHRRSGLFSQDDTSIDVSVTGSQLIRPLTPAEARRQSGLGGNVAHAGAASIEAVKKHPVSVAGSSIGSVSLGSGSDINALDGTHAHRKHWPFRRKWRRFQRKYKGCIFALLSSLASSLTSHFVHQLTTNPPKYDASYCMLWRYLGVLFPGIFIVMYYRCWQKEMVFDTVWPLTEKEPLKRFGLSVLRSVIDVVSVLLCYWAYKTLLQSETSTILNSKPVVVQLLAHFTLGEPWGIVPIVMSVLVAVGVLVVSKPPFLTGKTMEQESGFEGRLEGVGLSVASMLLAAVVYVILRSLKDVHYSVFSLFIGTVGLLFGLGLTLGHDEVLVMPELKDLGYFIGVAGLVCCSSISIVIALQNEEAFVVSLVRSCDVIFSFLWEITLMGTNPDWYSGGGACIIMFCVVVIFFRKYISHQDQDSKLYKRLHFLTK